MKLCLVEFKRYTSDGYVVTKKINQKWKYSAIKVARESRGLSCLDLSKESGVKHHVLVEIERGGVLIPDYVIEKISEALNYPIAFFEHEFKPIEWVSGHKSFAESYRAHQKIKNQF